jgi:hypothetical protein
MPAPKSECMGTIKHCATLAPTPSATPAAPLPATMYRVASKRSRNGCRNCKLRKVKVRIDLSERSLIRVANRPQCDETNRQQCLNCTSFRLVCNFKTSIPDMQLELLSASKVVQPTSVLRPPVTSTVWTADASYSYQLNAKCQDFITRYLRQSLCNPDDPNMARVNRELFALSFTVSQVIIVGRTGRYRDIMCMTSVNHSSCFSASISHACFSSRGISLRPLPEWLTEQPTFHRRVLPLLTCYFSTQQ